MLLSSLLSVRTSMTVVLALAACSGVSVAQSITSIGVLPNHNFSGSLAISRDGNTVAGASGVGFFNQMEPVRWNRNTGLEAMGVPARSINSNAQGVNADGSVVVGSVYTQNGYAFRWTASGGYEDIGNISEYTSAEAYGVSYDGNAIAATGVYADPNNYVSQAFRWTTSGGVQPLGFLPGGGYSSSAGISGDGNTVVGYGSNGEAEVPFVWTPSGGMQALPLLPGTTGGLALGASEDGRVIAGIVDTTAVIWNDSVPTDLGFLSGGTFSIAYSVSGDGRVVCGTSDSSTSLYSAMIWTAELGMVDLNSYLPTIGVDLTGWNLDTAVAVSFDGSVITGLGFYNGEERGWVVTIPAPGSAAMLGMTAALSLRRRRR